jgi:uncharacterized phage infection (PIP) family protein YhgE
METVETVLKLLFDFIAEYGVLATVVFAMLYNDRKKSKEQSENMKSMLKNQAEESKQQGKMLDVLMIQSTNVSKVVEAVSDSETKILSKADEIADKSSKERQNVKQALDKHTNTVQKNTESVTLMSQEFNILKSTIDGLKDNLRDDVKKLLQEEGITLSQDAINKVADIVMLRLDTKFTDLQSCIETAIKTATQETPKVELQASTKPIETPKTESPIKENKSND